MRFVKVLMVVVCVMALGAMVVAGEKTNSMGVRDVRHVTFVAPIQVGGTALPAGEYVVRHTMEGPDHIMVFERVHGKDLAKVKCTLVALDKKADRDQEVYRFDASNQRVLQELVFSGDTAKHVF